MKKNGTTSSRKRSTKKTKTDLPLRRSADVKGGAVSKGGSWLEALAKAQGEAAAKAAE